MTHHENLSDDNSSRIPDQRHPDDIPGTDKFEFRQDFGIRKVSENLPGSRQEIIDRISFIASMRFPDRTPEQCERIGRVFADFYGTLMGAARKGFLKATDDEPIISNNFSYEGFTMQGVRIVDPRYDPRHYGYTNSKGL